MITALAIGLVLGIRHALEADHVAAVAAVMTGMSSPRKAALRGAMWGLGHTITLLAFGGAFLLIGWDIGPGTSRILEMIVGIMLIAIGIDAMRNWKHLHVHEHHHDGVDSDANDIGLAAVGASHVHLHHHQPGTDHDLASHRHLHRVYGSARALGVGMVHGLAGSAALTVIAAESMASPTYGLGFLALFGFGSIIGMAIMSVIVALPVQFSARHFRRHLPKVVLLAGAASAAVGIHLIVTMAMA